MKALTAILLVGAFWSLTLAAVTKEQLNTIAVECMQKHKVDEQEAKDLWSGDKHHTKASPNAKCSMRCLMEKAGFMDLATSKFLPDAVRAVHKDDPNIEQTLKKCGSLDHAKPCEKAFAITVCIVENLGHGN